MSKPQSATGSRKRDLFLKALELQDPQERAAFLDGACGADAELRSSVEVLLRSHQDDSFLEHPAALVESGPALATAPVTEMPGDQIGRYKLLQKLGEGGMGSVWMAEQREPVRRKVALKIIKLGMDTREVTVRFEAERQALALMDHPNIAKVLDGGASDSGRPYFVMELVPGIRLTEYCDQNQLSIRERLDLFMKVCHAVQHAHQKGIIHRDLKPSNILVTLHDGVPVPKVIDFGIAKATQQQLTDKTLFTQLGAVMGTPAYMSPEQAELSGLDIDTRSDIYSLGVLLYQLLTGRPPFEPKELQAAGMEQMLRMIREKEPVRPSTRVTTLEREDLAALATRQGTQAPKLVNLIRGDLDWIVMKCLEKDRTRRYETANGLAADIQRHMANEPVVARPRSTAYKIQKTWQRNRLAFTAATAVALTLVVGISVSTWQAAVATRASKAESRQRILAEAAQTDAQTKQREAEAQRSRAEIEQQRADAQARKAVENQEHSRRLLYAADMNLAYQAVNRNNFGRARRLLERHRPAPGEQDLRGWEWRYLWQECRSDAPTQLTKRPEGRGFSVSFSPDGAQLAVGYLDGRIELWDVTRRVLLKELNQAGPPAHVAFSPRSNLLAATAGPGTLQLHDLTSGRETVLWQGVNYIRDLSFTPDGSRLLAFNYGQSGASAMLFDLAQGIALSTNATSGGNQYMGCARLSSDKKRFFLSHKDWRTRQLSVKCQDAETGRALWTADIGTDFGMPAMALSLDDKFLVTSTGFADATIRVWDAETGKLFTRLEGHTGWVRELPFSRDGRWLASAAADHTIRLWETSGWTEARVFRGHGDEVETVAFSPDGRMLASSAKDGAVLLWDIAARRSTYGYHLLPPDVFRLAEYAPGLAIAVEGNAQKPEPFLLRLEDQSQTRFKINASTNQGVTYLPPNLFARYEQTNVLRVSEYQKVESELLTEIVGPNLVRVPGSPSAALAHSREHRLIAWSETSGRIHIATLDRSARRWQWPSELDRPTPQAFSPDGKLLVLALGTPLGRSLEVREVTSGRLVLSSDLPLPLDHLVQFADAGRKLVMAKEMKSGMQVLFWDLSRPEQPPKRFEERAGLSALTVSPDGRWVAVGSDSGIAVLYDAVSIERRKVLDGTMQAVFSVTFSPDSRTLALGAGGREAVKLWQVETGQELLTLPGSGSLLRDIAFAEEGNTLLLGDNVFPGSYQMWRAPSWVVINAAEAKDLPAPGSGGQGKAESKQP